MQGEAKEYLIRKDGYFYRPNCQGYTTRKIEAGRYTKDKAEAEAAVEPWHMSAVHQDDVPDEPAVAGMNAEIARLQEQVETLEAELASAMKTADEYAPRAEAAKAERDRLRDFADWVDTWVSNPATSYSVYALDGLFAMTRDRLAALQKEPQP